MVCQECGNEVDFKSGDFPRVFCEKCFNDYLNKQHKQLLDQKHGLYSLLEMDREEIKDLKKLLSRYYDQDNNYCISLPKEWWKKIIMYLQTYEKQNIKKHNLTNKKFSEILESLQFWYEQSEKLWVANSGKK